MKNKHTILKLLRYDFTVGTRQTVLRYLAATAVLVFLCGLLMAEWNINDSSGNFWDLCFQLFRGIPEYKRLERNSQFQIPVMLMLHQLFLLFVIGSYPKEDMHGYGRQVFLENGSRKKWWFSKCIWTIGNILFYYILTYVFLAGCTFLITKDSFRIAEASVFLFAEGTVADFLKNICLLPFVTSIAFGILQLFVGIFLKPVYAYIGVVALMIVSAYLTTPFLAGNNLMLLRNYFLTEGKILFSEGMAVNVLMISIGLLSGTIYIQKYDILR